MLYGNSQRAATRDCFRFEGCDATALQACCEHRSVMPSSYSLRLVSPERSFLLQMNEPFRSTWAVGGKESRGWLQWPSDCDVVLRHIGHRVHQSRSAAMTCLRTTCSALVLATKHQTSSPNHACSSPDTSQISYRQHRQPFEKQVNSGHDGAMAPRTTPEIRLSGVRRQPRAPRAPASEACLYNPREPPCS